MGSLKGLANFVVFALGLLVATSPQRVWAFVASEEAQFQAEVDEAKARAKDFQRTLDRMARLEKERESAAHEMSVIREKEEAARARERADFVRERNSRPDPALERDRLEREHERRLALEAEREEEIRQKYVRAREKVRRVLEREAYIDQKKEYGL